MKIIKRLPLILLLMICLCVSTFGLADYELGKVRPLGGYSDHEIPGLGGDSPPAGGGCEAIGKKHGDNPFHGWPVKYRVKNWNTITSWFCDPNYFDGFTHWGIDIGRLNWDETIRGAAAISTAEYARVERSSYCAPPVVCYNSGMGNNVKIRALDCEEICETVEDLNGDGVIDPKYCDRLCVDTEWVAYYFHLLDVSVTEGEVVAHGDELGHINSSGKSTGDHLHYQINNTGKAIDPAPSMASSYTEAMRDQWKGDR
jgi:murein DD-endopeptidase MepM/ murein hydrolase activator NlpD